MSISSTIRLLPLVFLFMMMIPASDAQHYTRYFRSDLPSFQIEIEELLAKMTLEEKVHMLHGNGKFSSAGVERLGIPDIKYADGPLGIREELMNDSWMPAGWTTDSATFFPAGGGLSATWNLELAERYGAAIGEEARARGKDFLLAPAINIIRTPLCGRSYEYFSEDPFLNKSITAPYVKGVQDQDVAVCVKHYAVNNQETLRGSIDVLVDEGALRNIYLPAFKAAADAGAYSFMGAYNQFRGKYLCENDYLLRTILKDEWGFKGVVISDWAAVHSTVGSALNGLDVEMGTEGPYKDWYFSDALLQAVNEGKVSEALIDEKVARMLWVLHMIKALGPEKENRQQGAINTPEHHQVVYEVAAESIVLLKNSEKRLPIDADKVKSIAVIGKNAVKQHASGGFGAGVKAKYEVTPLEALEARLQGKVEINYVQGYEEKYLTHDNPYGQPVDHQPDAQLLKEAVAAAKASDIAILFIGSNRNVESEAADRKDLRLPFGQEELVAEVKKANPNTIVVVIAGAPFDLSRIEREVSTLMWSWFNGSEAGNALADVLLGQVNPSGKLPFTIPRSLKDSPAHATGSFPGDAVAVEYKESALVGYRWFDKQGIDPLYPFGYGLSYTRFDYTDFRTHQKEYARDEVITLTGKIKNSGSAKGKETVQVYVTRPGKSDVVRELIGFGKVEAAPDATESIEIIVPVTELARFNTQSGKWELSAGEYILTVGSSSRDLRHELRVLVK